MARGRAIYVRARGLPFDVGGFLQHLINGLDHLGI